MDTTFWLSEDASFYLAFEAELALLQWHHQGAGKK